MQVDGSRVSFSFTDDQYDPGSCHVPGLCRNLVPSSETSGALDMRGPGKSPGLHCLPPLAPSSITSQCGQRGLQKVGVTKQRGALLRPVEPLTSAPGWELSGQESQRTTLLPESRGDSQPLTWVACMIMWSRNPVSCVPLLPFDLCDRFGQTQSSRFGEKSYR